MPFTPYHFGLAGLIGYIFKKWVDLPVFVLANVVVDIEVLLARFLHLGRPYHRLGHTFLIGAAVGAIWGLAAYPALPILSRFMKKIRIPYQTNAFKMIVSGILGIWLHVLIDGMHHYNIGPLWPVRKNYLWQLFSRNQIKWICVICTVMFLILYVLSLIRKNRQRTNQAYD